MILFFVLFEYWSSPIWIKLLRCGCREYNTPVLFKLNKRFRKSQIVTLTVCRTYKKFTQHAVFIFKLQFCLYLHGKLE